MAKKNCGNKNCGPCSDDPIVVPATFSNDPEVCPEDSESCNELFDAGCICWPGPDICELDIKTGDRVDEVLQKILLTVSQISCQTPEDGADGEDGEDGADGLNGEINIVAVNTVPNGTPASVTDSNPDPRIADLTFDIPEGPEGPAGPGGTATSFDFSAADTYTDGAPNVIYDVGWSTATTNVSTDVFRYSFGDMHVLQGTLNFTGTYSGSLASDILLQIPGPTLNSAEGQRVIQWFTYNNVVDSTQVYLDNISGTNYLRFLINDNAIPTSSTTYNCRFYLLLLYNS